LSLPGLDTVVGRRLVEYLAKSVSRALESQLPAAAAAAGNNLSATALMAAATITTTTTTATTTAATATASGDDNDGRNDAVARGHTPPSSGIPSATAPVPQPVCPGQLPQTTAGVLHQPKPIVAALSVSNRIPPAHTVHRPKPTRPTFLRSPPQQDVAATAAAAAAVAGQRDPMWRPW